MKKGRFLLKNSFVFAASVMIFAAGAIFIWLGTIKMPDFRSFDEREVKSSTKIYDRTGEVLLYDIHENIKRTTIPFDEMGTYVKNATVAVEDSEFYQHKGIKLTSFLRAVLVNLSRGQFSQGGSTITQQVVKNSLLTNEKTISRKLKEWILAWKIDGNFSKEQILGIYLNEAPYGGTMYGIKEASRAFFGKEPKDMTLAEAAYLASIPKAPTFYSPYGKNKDKLDERKNFVLTRMKELNFVTEAEFEAARNEEVVFREPEKLGIRAPHFVFFVKDYLESRYGRNAVDGAGLKVITTLDYEMEEKAEAIVLKYAKENEKKFNGENAALVAMDPKTGQILAMVGSRDYFDEEIDGNFNVALAERQPGSAFKPFVYATAFKKGLTPNTVVFDLPTEFQTTCNAYGKALPGYKQEDCYMPQNYDGQFRGPMTLRDALAQSINVPAVKTFYLAGMADSIKTAREMGITTLTDPKRYGLTLVLGGGEVTLLDMTGAYATFADGGVRRAPSAILRIEDGEGNILEEYKDHPQSVLPKNVALMISSVLSDNKAKAPLYGPNSPIYFTDRAVASKTGTTNNYRDAWIVGYTPSLAVGAWAGNNDNTPMEKKTSGLIIAPLWAEFMREVLKGEPAERFEDPKIEDGSEIKPAIRGYWQGGESFSIDNISGKLATESTPSETRVEKIVTDVHSILYWVSKNDPMGPPPENPENDPQFEHWETPVKNWWANNNYRYPFVAKSEIPTEKDDVHVPEKKPIIEILNPRPDTVYGLDQKIDILISSKGEHPLQKIDVFINGIFLGSTKNPPFNFSFVPADLGQINTENELKIIAQDSVYNTETFSASFKVSLEN